jgi:hypothetical protein
LAWLGFVKIIKVPGVQVLGFAQGVQGEVNDDNWCDGLV